MSQVPTPHNGGKKGDFAKTVLMPGDPLRAKYIAETYLEDFRQVTSVRNMFGYTGTYKGKKVSVMGSGMGIPSIGIYSYELFKFYDVDTIIRIGSAGAYSKNVKVNDVILVNEAYSESTYADLIGLDVRENIIESPTENLNKTIEDTAKELNIDLVIGRCHSSDVLEYLVREAGIAPARGGNAEAAPPCLCHMAFLSREPVFPGCQIQIFSGCYPSAIFAYCTQSPMSVDR